jgi:tRNA threonylcarbamoyladenosine biosynthesis protein TsaB
LSAVWLCNCLIIEFVLILALDTSSPAGSVAVLRDRKVIASVSTWTDEIYSSRIFRHLAFLLHELSLNLSQFDLFAVATGPGSFTGLRVGLAAVKGWAEVYNKPIAAISGLEAVATQSHSTAPMLVPVLDARRGEVYFGCYRRVGEPVDNRLALDGAECVMTPEELLDTLHLRSADRNFAVVTPVPGLLSAALSRYETTRPSAERIGVNEVSAILAPYVGRLGYQCAQRDELAGSLTLDANYVRRTDAELHWKDPAGS